ncbi:centrosomal protein of 78 kDa isoform X2 [Spea bombifrons]|uniref:centrosomal protein of 78 kDa isoform X2 n=1 Tax=Spea bombifrons TaxID=233779 RepID=UPI002348F142|nr:centrosomal protein of 78 kDa isoform X2 [Spea bombifrons]
MINSVRVRHQGPMDFQSHYEYLCALQDSVPVPAIRSSFGQDVLSFNADRIKVSDWPPILNTLKVNKSLTSVSIKSCHQPGYEDSGAEKLGIRFKRRLPPIRSKDMTFQLCTCLASCLSVSKSLKHLELHGLPLRERDLKALSKGLAASSSLESLSLPYCSCGDEGLEIISKSVRNSPTLKTLDFTGCGLTWRGAECIANIIKHQATRRHSETWAESLRYRRPDLDCMAGLRRITLNCNALLGDRGAMALAEVLAEDLWLKALDLRQCGISSDGAQSLLNAFRTNTTLMILDVRRNPFIDHSLLKTITERVLMNSHGVHSEYKWFSSPSPKDGSNVRRKCRSVSLRHGRKGRNTLRIGLPNKRHLVSAGQGTSKELYAPEPKPPGSKGFLPWRTAERASRHRENSPDKNLYSPSQTGTSVKIAMDSETSESEETDSSLGGLNKELGESLHKSFPQNFRLLQVELKECQLRLNEEIKTRLKADERIMELELENTRLRQINQTLSDALRTRPPTPTLLEDEGVLDSIEKSFNKFHAFLDLLRDAGLGQLATLAGIDQSDFALPGDPQMTSTSRSHQPYTETRQNLHGTYMIPQLDESHTTYQKSKEEMGFDLDIKDGEGYKSSRVSSVPENTKDADRFKKRNLPNKKETDNECSSSDSSRSKKSSTSKKSTASSSETDRKYSSKRSLSAGTNSADPQVSVARNQNDVRTPLVSDANVSESEIQENINSFGSRSRGSQESM